MQVEAVTHEHRSRWGYHPVSYEEFLLLRRLHRRYWETLRKAYRWQRWRRKDPKNRRGPEPLVDAAYIDTSMSSSFFVPNRGGGMVSGGRTHHLDFRPLLGHPVGPGIVEDFRRARTPVERDKVERVNMPFYLEAARRER